VDEDACEEDAEEVLADEAADEARAEEDDRVEEVALETVEAVDESVDDVGGTVVRLVKGDTGFEIRAAS